MVPLPLESSKAIEGPTTLRASSSARPFSRKTIISQDHGFRTTPRPIHCQWLRVPSVPRSRRNIDGLEQEVNDKARRQRISHVGPEYQQHQLASPCLDADPPSRRTGQGVHGLDTLGEPGPSGYSVRCSQRAGALVNLFVHPLRGNSASDAPGRFSPPLMRAQVAERRSPFGRSRTRSTYPVHGSHGSESPQST